MLQIKNIKSSGWSHCQLVSELPNKILLNMFYIVVLSFTNNISIIILTGFIKIQNRTWSAVPAGTPECVYSLELRWLPAWAASPNTSDGRRPACGSSGHSEPGLAYSTPVPDEFAGFSAEEGGRIKYNAHQTSYVLYCTIYWPHLPVSPFVSLTAPFSAQTASGRTPTSSTASQPPVLGSLPSSSLQSPLPPFAGQLEQNNKCYSSVTYGQK